MHHNIHPMTRMFAEKIFTWRYPDEYALYNFQNTKEMRDEFLSGKYCVCLDDQNELIGFFAFGTSAQIPPMEEHAYDEDMLDIGLGMRPDLCGKGLGKDFLKLGMSFAKEKWNPAGFRLTVAVFNKRAMKAYAKAGFRQTKELTHKMLYMKFQVMVCEEF